MKTQKKKTSRIERLEHYLNKEEFQRVLDEYTKLYTSEEILPEEEQKRVSAILEKAKRGIQRNEIETILRNTQKLLASDKIDEAETELNKATEKIGLYEGDKKEDLEELAQRNKEMINKSRIDKIFTNIKKLCEKEDWSLILSLYDEIVCTYKEESIRYIYEFIQEKIRQKAKNYLESNFNKYIGFITDISNNSTFGDIARQIKDDDSKKLKKQIEERTKDKDFKNARNILEEKRILLDELEAKSIQEHITLCEEKVQKQAFIEKVSDINEALKLHDIEKAKELRVQVGSNPQADEETLTGLDEKIQEEEKAITREKNDYLLPQPLYNFEWFNISKSGIKNDGEDADPLIMADPKRNWGVIGVFDGMGGAGARKYIHKKTNIEHTSAWWASRCVKDAVESIIEKRIKEDIGIDPIQYLESNLHNAIKEKLDLEIENFPNTSSIMSKMIRKLPTTMALCVYYIDKNNNVTINSYWAGDSRVYLFDGEHVTFLTIDDANAPNNDPFSPANMDLAMNNAICQDQDFRINKSTIEIKLDRSKPFLLMAATDGCFGYFKNPILFEKTIRESLLKSSNWEQWPNEIQNAIIKNGKQDDLSMAMVAIGVSDNDFCLFKEKMTTHLSAEIFSSYRDWESSTKEKKEKIQKEIEELNTLLEISKKKKEECIKRNGDIGMAWNESSTSLSRLMSLIPAVRKIIDIEKINSIVQSEQTTCEEDEKNSGNDSQRKQQEISEKKNVLEKLLLDMEEENNRWYEKYKDQGYIHIILINSDNNSI